MTGEGAYDRGFAAGRHEAEADERFDVLLGVERALARAVELGYAGSTTTAFGIVEGVLAVVRGVVRRPAE